MEGEAKVKIKEP